MPIALGPFPPLGGSHSGLPRPRILYIDAFDSFSNNIVGLLEQSINAVVSVARINDVEVSRCLLDILRAFDAVVIGPGPGHPAKPKDVGLINQLWQLQEADILPIFGVCLGFQSLCLSHGARIERLQRARHGTVSKIQHIDMDIFQGIRNLHATQYHSLYAVLGEGTTTWDSTPQCPLMLPLAWDSSDELNGPILMAARHLYKPFWGVQFHPESICTSKEGMDMIQNWWSRAQAWSISRQRSVTIADPDMTAKIDRLSAVAPPGVDGMRATRDICLSDSIDGMITDVKFDLVRNAGTFLWRKVPWPSITPVMLCENLNLDRSRIVMLDSQGHATGRFSIIGIPTSGQTQAPEITYRSTDKELCYTSRRGELLSAQVDSISRIWPILQDTLDRCDPRSYDRYCFTSGLKGTLPESVPFWGGFMGYISYEAGLETIDVKPHESCYNDGRQDIKFAFIERSIVIDHRAGDVYVQSLLPDDECWIREMRAKIRSKRICLPKLDALSVWDLYQRLRLKNPAPHGAYVCLGDTVILSSSPERFLRWDRKGLCQLRPIKGTVKKGPDMTRDEAHKILNSSKERAENLMIVDLVRHDLSGVVGAANVRVPKCMVVEEYETVYQLVSVIEGQLPTSEDGKSTAPKGLDVLKASLPPGSMTGAPKKRSCEILRDIEKRPRGIYSGVLGYMDVGGGGDFSVVIRTAIKGLDKEHDTCDVWDIGAGGAITIQSDDKAEFLEMETKVTSALRAFEAEKQVDI
ncbi:para-aminobenzoate synthase [Pseudovirgaria hyperparasitica]|uniref:aminodeoxychorismate synthase n=1 Tax=Pseudovirgaria hyperparasitica TaxID=470096 RepID=A0A6A6W4A5_9PEZI|nr:para-aminobenzoate synthase [Pseudovirgaria hyperparasitica]KAF2756864.1 para-aminobenzoate synthase [Pseudovirgaria hyperparasitica]